MLRLMSDLVAFVNG